MLSQLSHQYALANSISEAKMQRVNEVFIEYSFIIL